jgi:thiol-disulfide isomerase/thioredoxin
MLKRALIGLASCAALFAGAAQGQDLKVGSTAPALEHVEWVKGEAVSEFRSGQIYVLDFWATWCGPCVASIPHINELQKEYKDRGVNVIAVAIWPREGMVPTVDFVEKKGDGMDYRVAEDVDGKTALAYMEAAGQAGIPTVMVVGRDGTVQWIGHPMELDNVLEPIVDGEFDAASYAKKQEEDRQRQLELQMKARPHIMALQQGMQGEDWGKVSEAVDALIELDRENFAQAAAFKYIALVKSGESQEAARWGAQVASTLYADQPQMLNMFAWMMVDPEGPLTPEEVDAKLAVTVAEKASALTDDADPNVLDTLARAHYLAGDMARAVEMQRKAVELCEMEALKADLEKRLAEYEKAASAG